jgi:hypothetical protein|uniref:Uncharacterized protein n=1 Tax=viral metagenome TaxID=1070528 RepID=A0A6C0DUR1_9ZZZZ
MLSWILQITIISIILIFLVHHLIQFFRDTLTVPKIKDLVNAPTQKYENMFSAMNRGSQNENIDYNTNFDESYKKSLLPPSGSVSTSLSPTEFDVASMKDELKSYLKNQHFQSSSSINDLESNYMSAPSSKKKVKITELM